MSKDVSFERRYRLVREVIETVVLTLLMFLIINLAIQNFDVVGHSMEGRLHDGERVMVDKVSYIFHSPARGDIIVFDAPPQPGTDYVKRIIGVPGDTVTVDHGAPIVNGVRLHETYVDPQRLGPTGGDRPVQNLRIPDGYYFTMGDNRVGSSDSRSWGLLPRKNIHGRVVLVYWPLGQDNNGFLPDVSSVYTQANQKAQHAPSPAPLGTLPDPGAFSLSAVALFVFLKPRFVR